MSDLTGKSVLITGGASGVIAATARAFYEAGAQVTIVDIQKDWYRQLTHDRCYCNETSVKG